MKTFKQHFNEGNEGTQFMLKWDQTVKSNPELKAAVELLNEIESLGGTVLITGGAVRDIFMGEQPHDIDLSGNIPIEKIEEHFKIYDIGKGKDFGVIVIPYKGFQFEYAVWRNDIY